MRVFVAGGTGVVGRSLVPLLVERGHDVTATTRTPAKAEELRALGAEPVVVDALDPAALRRVVLDAQPETLVHQLTALSGIDYRRFDRSFATTNALRTHATDALLASAREAGTRRFVAQSYFSATMPDPPSAMRATVAAMRHLERAVTTADVDGLVLRYGGFYGPGTSLALDGEVVELLRKRRYPIVGDGAGVWSFVHIDDVAEATVAAVEADEVGILDIVDDVPAPVSEWLPALADAVGAPPPQRVPVWLGRLLAGDAVVAMSTRLRGTTNAEARDALGWSPRWPSWRDGFRRGLVRTEGQLGSRHGPEGHARASAVPRGGAGMDRREPPRREAR
jgi:nucleoside-diphosphate-sugar epimerase